MDLKRKFKSLLHRQDSPRSPVEEEVTAAAITNDPAVTKFKEHVNEYPNDPHADREVIESIEQDYYGETFDASRYELLKLSEVLDLTQIDDDRTRLRRQLQVVSKTVSEVVLANQAGYETELQRVMELQQSLQTASIICADGRSCLYHSRQNFTTASLALLANYRKRQQLNMLLQSLRTIKTLQRTEMRLREMLEEEDFAGAIQLCLECQKAASTFRHYTCISELSSKLQDTLEMIEEQLDVALSKTCIQFDTEHYSKVQTAYRMLGKTQTAMDQLHMHYASAIHNTAFTIVLGYVELCSGTKTGNFQKRQYPDLCRFVENDTFIPCLIDLCKALWEVMKSYQMTIEWHERYDMGTTGAAASSASDTDSGASHVEATLNRRYIKQKLEHGLGRIWQDVQQKVKTYILATDLSGFKFDGFIQVLDLVNRLIMIGEEFCCSRSESLQDSLKQQSLNYFKNFHRSRMEELRMFLENESWELCPVKSNFTLLQLLEFRFMRNWTESNRPSANIIPSSSSNSSIQSSGERSSPKPNHGYFDKFRDDGNPFDIQKTDDEKEDVLANGLDDSNQSQTQDSDSDSDIPDELKQDYIDELTGDAPSKRTRRQSSREKRRWKTAPIITNTTLNVLRVIGKYLQMMTFLKPIAFDVTLLMSQLFDYYLYAVYTFFGLDMPELTELTLNNRLKITIQRIQDSLIAEEQGLSGLQDDKPQVDRIPPPHLSPVVDFSEQKLYGLSERIVAAESLVFLACQFDQLQPHLENMIPTNKKAFLQQFYSQTVNMAKELRKPIYGVVSARAIDYDQLLQLMGLVRWDVREIMSQHNSYVDVVLKEFTDFQKRLAEIGRHMPVPKPVHDTLWEQCIRIANRSFVEGYTCAKKCSNEGRALMQLDFQQYITKLEKLTDIRPVPDRDFVENYIKAYYLPEAQLEQWIKDHKEYTSKQLSALVNCVDHVNKKARQRLTTLIEEMERPRR